MTLAGCAALAVKLDINLIDECCSYCDTGKSFYACEDHGVCCEHVKQFRDAGYPTYSIDMKHPINNPTTPLQDGLSLLDQCIRKMVGSNKLSVHGGIDLLAVAMTNHTEWDQKDFTAQATMHGMLEYLLNERYLNSSNPGEQIQLTITRIQQLQDYDFSLSNPLVDKVKQSLQLWRERLDAHMDKFYDVISSSPLVPA